MLLLLLGGVAARQDGWNTQTRQEGRDGRGLASLFAALAADTSSQLVRGGNSTGDESRGIFDFVADVATSIIGGATDKNSGPVLIPNHCW